MFTSQVNHTKIICRCKNNHLKQKNPPLAVGFFYLKLINGLMLTSVPAKEGTEQADHGQQSPNIQGWNIGDTLCPR